MYPLLSKLPKAPASLSTQLQTIFLAAAHVAAGDAGSTVAAFRHIDKELHGKAYELTILQAAPLVGIPRTLHSAAALQSVGITGEQLLSEGQSILPYESMDQKTVKEIKEIGETTFSKVYGRNETRVRHRLKTFHPGLDEWIQTCIYGWTFSKTNDQISLKERELSTVAMLCVDMSAGVQLASHIRGAILAGAEVDEVEAVIKQTEVICETSASNALAVWKTYHRARYAL